MRIVFLGSGEICLPTLEALISHSRHDLVGVVTQPDKQVGRKQTVEPPKVKRRSLAAGVPVQQPPRIRRPEALEGIASWNPDVIVVMAYGQILPPDLLDVPAVACLNLHASLLPRHRGAAPIQAAIREGDAESGITVMYMAEGLDTGDILLKRSIPLEADETGESLHDRLAVLAPEALEAALELLEAERAPRFPQDEALATYAGKLEREDGRIDWNLPSIELERMIRAYHPWPGAFTTLTTNAGASRKVKFFPPVHAEPGVSVQDPPGTLLEAPAGSLRIATGNGCLDVSQLQVEGKKRLSVAAFQAGSRLDPGTVFGR